MRWIPAATLAAAALAALSTLAAVPPGNVLAALEAQARLAAENPTEPAVLNDLGNLLVMAERLEEAEAAYRRALELDPGRVSTRFNYALLLQQRGRYAKAREQYLHLLEVAPDHAWGHYQLGVLRARAGQQREAIASYARALALDPRLGFPEVNPHVIDNELFTEAMLLAYREPPTGPAVPKAFDDPQRIAGLLLPIPTLPEEEEQELVPGEGADELAGDEAGAGGPVDLTDPSNPIASGGVRQAPEGTGPTRVVAPPAGEDDPVRERRDERPGANRQNRPGGIVVQGGGTAGGTAQQRQDAADARRGGTARGGAERSVPSTRVRYRAGTESTGRLEMRLLPGGDTGGDRPAR